MAKWFPWLHMLLAVALTFLVMIAMFQFVSWDNRYVNSYMKSSLDRNQVLIVEFLETMKPGVNALLESNNYDINPDLDKLDALLEDLEKNMTNDAKEFYDRCTVTYFSFMVNCEFLKNSYEKTLSNIKKVQFSFAYAVIRKDTMNLKYFYENMSYLLVNYPGLGLSKTVIQLPDLE